MANIFKKIGSNVLDMAKLAADNSLSQFGMTNVIKDSDYENNAWESASKVMNPLFKTGTAIAAGLIPGASALIGTTQSVGNAVNPINPNQLPDNNGVKTFKKGGELTYYIGNPEQVDGITVANRFKADDGEVSFKRKDGSQYMFSNTLKLPNKKITFATAAKKIESKYKSEDKYDVKARKKELENLADIHEMVRQADEMEQYAKGGMLPGYIDGGVLVRGLSSVPVKPEYGVPYKNPTFDINTNPDVPYKGNVGVPPGIGDTSVGPYAPYNSVDLSGYTANPYESNTFKNVSTGSRATLDKMTPLKGKVSTYSPPITPIEDVSQFTINGSKDMWIDNNSQPTVKNAPLNTDNSLPTMSKVGMGVQAASTLTNGIMMATRKPQYQKFNPLANVYLKRFNPNAALQESKETFAGAANDIRKASGSTGQLLANRVNLATGASKAASGIKQQYEGMNAEVQNKEAMINADIAMKNAEMKLKIGEINAQEYDAIRDQWMNYIDGVANQGAGASKDVMAYNNAKQYANATQRFKTPNGWFKLNPKTGEFELESKKKGGKV